MAADDLLGLRSRQPADETDFADDGSKRSAMAIASAIILPTVFLVSRIRFLCVVAAQSSRR
jgi:hypothetical protein